MSLLAASLNDASITFVGGGELLYREPGVALLDDDHLVTGTAALQAARIRPRHVQDHYWSELSAEPLPDRRFRHLSAADLVSRQLEDIWQRAAGKGDRLVMAVPAYMDSEKLALLLGIVNELNIPVVALVDAAVAATRREYVDATPVHVDLSLHSALLTRLAQPGHVQVEKSAVVEGAGLVALYDAWLRMLAEVFVRQSRFDPLHTAETEQILLDRLPEWLKAASSSGKVTLEIDYQGIGHAAEVEALDFVNAAAPVYHRIVTQLRALYRADDLPATQLTGRAAGLPGLADMLRARVGGELFLLEPGATARGLLTRCGELAASGGQVSLIRQLPWDQPPVRLQAAELDSAGGRPTHLLCGDVAWAIDGAELNIGSQPAAGERWVSLEPGMPGLSRRHCSLVLDNGQCVVRDFSRYGTFLNGHRVDGSAVLQVGDRLRVGTPGFELRLIRTEDGHGA